MGLLNLLQYILIYSQAVCVYCICFTVKYRMRIVGVILYFIQVTIDRMTFLHRETLDIANWLKCFNQVRNIVNKRSTRLSLMLLQKDAQENGGVFNLLRSVH